MQHDSQHEAEQWLDQALAAWGKAEPRPGLEQRVLANLSAQPQRSRTWAWTLAAGAVAVAVALALSVALLRAPQPTATQRAESAPGAAPAVPVAPAIVSRPEAAAAVRPAAPQRSTLRTPALEGVAEPPLPRLARFPSPAPASEQHRLAARYARPPLRLLALAAPPRSAPEGTLAEIVIEQVHIEQVLPLKANSEGETQ